MRFAEYRYLLLSDVYRITGSTSLLALLHELIVGDAYKYNFWMRTCRYARGNLALGFCLLPFAYYMLRRCRYRYGISIPFMTEIGAGFYIGHFGGIVVNRNCRIGRNCNISQGVTLGQANRGTRKGFPSIGDNVYIAPGAKVIGAVRIGNDVAIGANCVVTKDVPDGAVVVGVPGRIISYGGSEGYVNRTDYEDGRGLSQA